TKQHISAGWFHGTGVGAGPGRDTHTSGDMSRSAAGWSGSPRSPGSNSATQHAPEGRGARRSLSPPLGLMALYDPASPVGGRAFQVQMLLADRGQHRIPSIPDLLIAATAEKAALTVLAVDKDFDLIAAITVRRCRKP